MTAEPIHARGLRLATTLNTNHVEQFIEQLGRLAEGEGLPRTAGRMMALLILTRVPLGIDDFAVRLKVSRASVSSNSRLLQSLAIAELVSDPGNRRDYLQISGDPSTALLTVGLQRMRSMQHAIRAMRLAMPGTSSSATRARLQRMETFYEETIAQIQSVLHKWNKSEHPIAPDVGLSVSVPVAKRLKIRRG